MMIPSHNSRIEDFASSLLVDFDSLDTIPFFVNESNWRQWGDLVAASPSFAINSVPTTENFPSWVEWGIILYGTMGR